MMPYVALFLVGAGGWFLAAAFFRYHGYIWLDQTCNGIFAITLPSLRSPLSSQSHFSSY